MVGRPPFQPNPARSPFTPRQGPGPRPIITFELLNPAELRRIQSFLKDAQSRYSSKALLKAAEYYRQVFFPRVRVVHSQLLKTEIERGTGRAGRRIDITGDSQGLLANALRTTESAWKTSPGYTGFSFNREELRKSDPRVKLYYAIQDVGSRQFLGDKLTLGGRLGTPDGAARSAAGYRIPSFQYIRSSARGYAVVRNPIKGYDYSQGMAKKAVEQVIKEQSRAPRGIAGGTGTTSPGGTRFLAQHAETLKEYMGLKVTDRR